ncbi:MAG TPA: AMIN domain-containing protein, partial [Labilithrix sp.]|nr:AMIN domain-containing protein [Labilithrix sp.]
MRKRGSIHERVLQLIGAQAILLSAALAWADVGPQTATNHVQDVKVHATDAESGATEIDVLGTSSPVFNVRVENGGRRLVVDISNSDIVGVKEAVTTTVGVVGGVLTQAFKTESGQMTRLSINLNKQAAYRVRADGTSLKISLTPAATTAPAPAPAKDEVSQPSGPALLDIRYERAKAPCSLGCDRIVIATTEVPPYSLSTSQSGRLRLELKRMQLAKPLSKTLDVSQGKGAVKSVTAFYDDKAAATFVEIDKGGDSGQGTISVDGKNLVWSFDSVLAKSAPKAPARKSVTVARES